MERNTWDRPDPETGKGGSFATDGDEDKSKAAGRSDVIDTNAEEAYWRQNFASRPYVTEGTPFIEYRPAFRYGADAYSKHRGRSFEQAEPELMQEWDKVKGTSSLAWDDAKHAARDAWHRVSDFLERATPGDSDNDGK